MLLKSQALALLAFLSVASSTPVPETQVNVHKEQNFTLVERAADCQISVWYTIYEDPFGGITGSIPSTDMYANVVYAGGQEIGGYHNSDDHDEGPDLIRTGGVGIPGNLLGLPQNMYWNPTFSFGQFYGCELNYGGVSYPNYYLSNVWNPCADANSAGPGWSCSWCGLDFACEGGLGH